MRQRNPTTGSDTLRLCRRRLGLAAVWAGALIAAVGVCALGGDEPRTAALDREPSNSQNPDVELHERAVYGQLLYRDRPQQVILKRAEREFEAGNSTQAIIYLQTLLDRPNDAFAWLKSRPQPTSIREEAHRLLASGGQRTLKVYERMYGAEAERLLDRALATGDAKLLREIHRRFFYTRAGFAAVDRQAALWFDRGQLRLAAWAWDRILSDPIHQGRASRSLLLKAATANALCGRREEARALLRRMGDGPIQLAGGPAGSRESLINHVDSVWPRVPGSRVSVPGDSGQAHHGRVTTPLLDPQWVRPYADHPNDSIEVLVKRWEASQRENLRPVAVAGLPAVAGNTVIVRGFSRIIAIDAGSGERLWAHKCTSSLESASRHNDRDKRSAASGSVDVGDAYTANAVLGMMATDGKRVYAVDDVDLGPDRSRSRRRRRWPIENDDEKPISRRTNRLIALRVDWEGHGQQDPVWSVGGAIQAPAWFTRADRDGDDRVVRAEFEESDERFAIIDANGNGSISLLESITAKTGNRDGSLAGHFFLGPPLCAAGALYAVTEADRQLNLVALEPETGKLLWKQGIGYVETPIHLDAKRFPLACTPSFADGILVCPTQLGVLVAVDAFTGTLQWACYYGDRRETNHLTRWPHRTLSNYGHKEFPSIVRIEGARVVVLPRQSSSVHCIDLYSGRPLWEVPREDGQYIGAIRGDIVLIVGTNRSRGVSLETGQELWAARLGMPSGRGIRAGENYLVPLQDGRIATLDISTGHDIGFTLPAARYAVDGTFSLAAMEPSREWHPGNLAACGGLVLSAGPRHLIAFPQAGAQLQIVRERLAREPESPRDLVRAAELSLALGRMDDARDDLTKALAAAPLGERQARAELLMREVLYLKLRDRPTDDALLSELDELSKTPEQRGRFLMRRAESQLQQGDAPGVLASLREFAALDLNRPLPAIDDPSLLVTSGSWVPGMIARLAGRSDGVAAEAIHEQIDIQLQESLASGDLHQLQKAVEIYGSRPQAAAARLELARRYVASGQFQRAELLLLENRRSNDPHVAADATARLVQLWDGMGLWQPAGRLLLELDRTFGDVPLADGRTGREFADSYPAGPLVSRSLSQQKQPGWEVSRVTISQRLLPLADPQLIESRSGTRLSAERDGAFQLFLKTKGRHDTLAVVDRQSGVLAGTIKLPSRIPYRSRARMSRVGHMVFLGSKTEMDGVSLLERGSGLPLWTTTPSRGQQRNEVFQAGPAGPTFCTFQAQGQLVVVSPADGRIRWQRTNVETNGRPGNERDARLFGDAEVLVFFSPDDGAYTVFRTATGQELKRGRLDFADKRPWRPFGRKLSYMAETDTTSRLRIWDPLDDRIEFDMPLEGSFYTAETPDEELVLLLASGRLLIIDPKAVETILAFQFEPEELANLNYLRVFSDRDRYYVNLQRAVSNRSSRTYSTYTTDTYLDTTRVQGDLYAIDRRTGELDWQRRLPQRSVLQPNNGRLPFLITMSRVRERWNSSHRREWLLVEVIDASSGETIGYDDTLASDRIAHFDYDPDNGRIILEGLKTEIKLNFDRPLQRISLDDKPL